ncbi:MAG: beta-lactamase family protein [Planctomycetes bacterium]|nr:beta-lactamase family protein [Planctomycetota bacterium]
MRDRVHSSLLVRAIVASLAMATVRAPAVWAQPNTTQVAAAADISKTLEPLLTKHDLPAMAAIVIRGDAIIAQGVSGVRAHGHEDKATLGDLWHLGSCTKSMTATMLATLVESGQLNWSTTIGDVFTDLPRLDDAWKPVTLELLLAHRAGVPADLSAGGLWGTLWNHAGTPTEQRRTLVESLLAKPPLHAPGSKFLYANAGFAIAGAMAEKISGQSWEDLIQERLFRPLGITSAGFGAPGTPGVFDQPRGHEADDKPVEPGPHHAGDNPAAIGPGGTVHMSLPDWGRYISLHLAGERGDSKLLKPETIRAMHHPAGSPDATYGWGWSFTQRPWAGGTTFTHSGSNTLWYSVAWVAPAKNMAVLIVCNKGGSEAAKGCDAAASALVKQYIAGAEAIAPRPDMVKPESNK